MSWRSGSTPDRNPFHPRIAHERPLVRRSVSRRICAGVPTAPEPAILDGHVDLLTAYGALAVCAMLVFYALESRAAVFVLAFAGACAASSLYGFLQGAWPFGVVEAVWCVVALGRWWRRRAAEKLVS